MIYNPKNIILPPLAAGNAISEQTARIRAARRTAGSIYAFGRPLKPSRGKGRIVYPFCPGLHRVRRVQSQRVLRGRAKCFVMDERGEVLREYPWEPNLIYNLGIDNACNVTTLAALSANAVSGTGTGDTKRDSGATTASQGGSTTVTSSASFFVAGDVGNMIKWDSGEEARITAFTSGTSVEVTPAQTVSSGQFTVHETNDPQMSVEHARTSTYLTGAGNCETTIVSNTITMRRTYDFPVEGSGVTIREVGLSNSGSGGSNLFNRVFLSSPVALLAGQALRLVFDLDITCTPAAADPITAAISGWPVAPATTTDGDQLWTGVCLSGPINSGASNDAAANAGINGDGQSMEPSVISNTAIALNTSSAALGTFNGTTSSLSGTRVLNKLVSGNTYNSLDFFREKSIICAVGEANSTQIRKMILGGYFAVAADAADAQGLILLFDEDQTKANTHTLELIFRITMGRTLTN